mgnify:CR=1 FL=1
MLAMAMVVLVLQLMVIYIPPVAEFFSVYPLGPADLAVTLGAGVVVFAVVEIVKWITRLRAAR